MRKHGAKIELFDNIKALFGKKKAKTKGSISSWPGLSRPSTSSVAGERGCRAKRGMTRWTAHAMQH